MKCCPWNMRVATAGVQPEAERDDDAVEFCRKLSERAEEKGAGRQYRLPTEAEWEFACRAGTTTAYCSGDGLEALKKVGWCSYDNFGSAGKTKPVGSFEPNAWGLFDMHGNVLEWCADWYGPYSDKSIKDPVNDKSGERRVLRGGSWDYLGRDCRAAFRRKVAPDNCDDNFGFRVVGVVAARSW